MKLKYFIFILFCQLSNIISAQNENEILQYWNFGNDLFEQKRYEDAVTIYTNAIDFEPKDQKTTSKLYESRGLSYFFLKNDSLALQDFNTAIITDSTNRNAHSILVYVLLGTRDLQQAIDAGLYAISCIGEDYHIRTNIGFAYYYLKEISNAIQQFTFAINTGCANNEAYTMRGYCYADLKKLDKAKDNFDKAFNYEEDYLSHKAYGWYYRHIGNYEQAIYHYKMALSFESNFDCYKLLAFTLIENNNEFESIFYLDSALAIYPSAHLYHNRANSYADIGEYDKALLNYETSLELDSLSDENTYLNRAYRVWFDLKKYKLAKQDLLISISINDSNDYAWNNLGYANFKLGDLNEGLLNVKKSIKLNPENSYSYKNLALIYYKKENIEQAKLNANKALDLDYPYKDDGEFLKLLKKLDITPN